MAIFHKTLQHHEDTTEKRDISQEDIEFLKRLQLEMNTQDTTGTADPRFWVIKGSERVVDNENPDELVLQVDGSTVTSTTEETVKYLNDNILPDCNIDRENCKIETGTMAYRTDVRKKRRRKARGKAMKCSISTYYKILDAELYNYDDGYMQLNVDIDTKNIDLEEYVSMQKKSIADMCNVPEEKVIPISRLEYETYTDE